MGPKPDYQVLADKRGKLPFVGLADRGSAPTV